MGVKAINPENYEEEVLKKFSQGYKLNPEEIRILKKIATIKGDDYIAGRAPQVKIDDGLIKKWMTPALIQIKNTKYDQLSNQEKKELDAILTEIDPLLAKIEPPPDFALVSQFKYVEKNLRKIFGLKDEPFIDVFQ